MARKAKETEKKTKSKASAVKQDYSGLGREWKRRQKKLAEAREKRAAQLQTTMADDRDDRMLRHVKNPICPACGAHPTVCRIRRPGYELRYCRVCGHRFEIKEQSPKDRLREIAYSALGMEA